MKRKLLTLDDLYSFFDSQNKSMCFSASKSGYNIAVQIPAVFEKEDSDDGFLHVKFKVNHIGKNRNGSSISEESQLDALPTLHYRPVLAAYTTLPDGTLDFTYHAMEFNDDGSIKYIEQPVGTFVNPDSYKLEYDKENDKTYVMADAVIYSDYCAPACEIIERKNGTKVSCELCISELSYDANEKVLNLDKFRYNGVTCLGTDPDTFDPVQEGMEGARLDIADFSEENNSVFVNKQDEIIKLLHSLQEKLAKFENKDSEEGGNGSVKFEELLEKYGITAEDIDFEYDGLSDEELEAKFSKKFGTDEEDVTTDVNEEEACKKKKKKCSEDEENIDTDVTEEEACKKKKKKCSEDEEDIEDVDTEVNEEEACKKKKKKCSANGDMEITYEISHDDIRSALYNLLWNIEDTDEECYYINSVYDEYFIYSNWNETKIYKHSYSVNEDIVTIADERTQLFKEYLTTSEKTALDEMRSNYAAIKEELNKYKSAELQSKKDAILNDEDYSLISETEEFKSLVNDADKYSVEELQDKADALLGRYTKKNKNFSFVNKPKKVGVTFDDSIKDDEPYGDLFDGVE